MSERLGRPTNRMIVEWLEDGGISVEYIELTPEEYAAQPLPPQPKPRGFHLDIPKEEKDPILRMIASEAAIHGFSDRSHIWGK